MKRINPDLQATLTNKFIGELAFLRKFKKYWGTEIVDGVEVFKQRNYYYPANKFEEPTKKLARLLGIYSDLQAKMEGVRSAWLTLNIDKAPGVSLLPATATHTSNMNIAMSGVTEGSVTISSKVIKKKVYEEAPIFTNDADQPNLITEVQNKFQSLWDGDYSIYGNATDDYQCIFFMLLLRSKDIKYTITKVEKIMAPVTYQTSWNVNTVRVDTQPSWRVDFTIENPTVGDNTDLIRMISDAVDTPVLTAERQIQQHLTSAISSAGNDDGVEYNRYEPTTVKVSEFWHTKTQMGPNNRPSTDYWLKTSILTSPSLSRKDKIKYITSCVDTGYRKKSAKWYEVVIVFIIVIVAIIYSAGTASGAAAGVTSAFWGSAVAISVTITLAAFYLAVIAYALGAAGLTRMAGTLGEFLKSVEPLVRVAGVIAIVGSFINMWREVATRASQQAIQEGATTSITQIVSDMVVETTRSLIERVTGITSIANMQTSHVLKMTEFLFGIYQSDRTKEMNKMLKNERAELADLYAMDEQSKTSDILKDFALTYPNLLAQDHSEYANRYDRPYEWWATPYHAGCIQATTVNALWLSKD